MHANFHLNQVMNERHGSQYCLTIIYAEVAKRLGVSCEIVSSLNPVNGRYDGVLLRWMEFPE